MSVPKTYLLTAPSDCDDLFGRGMASSELVRKLKKLNQTVWVESEYEGNTFGIWSPGKTTGITCLWHGFPGRKDRSKKISAFIPGVIPEFTQLDEKGFVMQLGWRRILQKAVWYKAAMQVDIEKAFGVTLDVRRGAEDGVCFDCRKQGKMTKATSANNLCDFHSQLLKQVDKAESFKNDLKWLRRKYTCQQLPLPAASSLMDSPTKPSSALSG